MSRLHQIWLILMGDYDLFVVLGRLAAANATVGILKQQIARLERDLALSNAGITELKGKFHQLGGEEKIRRASDAIGQSVIDDMIANPTKYVPKADS